MQQLLMLKPNNSVDPYFDIHVHLSCKIMDQLLIPKSDNCIVIEVNVIFGISIEFEVFLRTSIELFIVWFLWHKRKV